MHAQLMNTTDWQRDTAWTREAKAAGVLDLTSFAACMRSDSAKNRLAQQKAMAETLGVTGTPVFFSRSAMHRGVASKNDLLALDQRK